MATLHEAIELLQPPDPLGDYLRDLFDHIPADRTYFGTVPADIIGIVRHYLNGRRTWTPGSLVVRDGNGYIAGLKPGWNLLSRSEYAARFPRNAQTLRDRGFIGPIYYGVFPIADVKRYAADLAKAKAAHGANSYKEVPPAKLPQESYYATTGNVSLCVAKRVGNPDIELVSFICMLPCGLCVFYCGRAPTGFYIMINLSTMVFVELAYDACFKSARLIDDHGHICSGEELPLGSGFVVRVK